MPISDLQAGIATAVIGAVAIAGYLLRFRRRVSRDDVELVKDRAEVDALQLWKDIADEAKHENERLRVDNIRLVLRNAELEGMVDLRDRKLTRYRRKASDEDLLDIETNVAPLGPPEIR